ncbi:hypothetical protein Javan237_0023 [Streptococcus phage Javan237]|uniref:hypothetical protein n=1 Tax=Streptococcus gallolyticus TaxID=315405 RepID=UPI0010C46F9A|nr:hypothetical protein [Streptococcus gallolyticus]QBX16221.1 hypothetical protein Javan237_0023 [Streptococcus phage Javan237]QBX25095.1 hypothetical protein Javan238_0023 [Streptococcus phage Javan238]
MVTAILNAAMAMVGLFAFLIFLFLSIIAFIFVIAIVYGLIDVIVKEFKHKW